MSGLTRVWPACDADINTIALLPPFNENSPSIAVPFGKVYVVEHVRSGTLRMVLDGLSGTRLRGVRFLPDMPPNHWLREAYGSYLSFKCLAMPEDVGYDGSWCEEPYTTQVRGG